jgi:hypothetical protein
MIHIQIGVHWPNLHERGLLQLPLEVSALLLGQGLVRPRVWRGGDIHLPHQLRDVPTAARLPYPAKATTTTPTGPQRDQSLIQPPPHIHPSIDFNAKPTSPPARERVSPPPPHPTLHSSSLESTPLEIRYPGTRNVYKTKSFRCRNSGNPSVSPRTSDKSHPPRTSTSGIGARRWYCPGGKHLRQTMRMRR